MDREKVIKGLKYLHDVKRWSPDESEESITARRNITGDALALLKAQEPRLLTLEEIHDSMVVWLEAGTKLLKIVDDDGVVLAIGGSSCANAKCFITVWNVSVAAMNDEYNITWRAWSQRPTKEQRENEPWDRRANDDQR